MNRTPGTGATLASPSRDASALLAKHLRGPVQYTPAQQAAERVLIDHCMANDRAVPTGTRQNRPPVGRPRLLAVQGSIGRRTNDIRKKNRQGCLRDGLTGRNYRLRRLPQTFGPVHRGSRSGDDGALYPGCRSTIGRQPRVSRDKRGRGLAHVSSRPCPQRVWDAGIEGAALSQVDPCVGSSPSSGLAGAGQGDPPNGVRLCLSDRVGRRVRILRLIGRPQGVCTRLE